MKRCILLLGLLIACSFSYSQTIRIIGSVTDENSHNPLSGVTVTEKGTSNATATDAEGNFSINVANPKSVLVLSFVGYKKQEIQLNNQKRINISLTPAAAAMDEVVVTAFGIRRQTKDLTYATQQVKGKDIAEVKDATGSLVNALSGKIAGLEVTQSATGPGGDNRVILRGNRSIGSSNNALFVVDGVAIDGSMNNLNPDDVESVNVLKGASAAALYGSRAANGVIIITTKKGKAGRTMVDVSSGVTVSTPTVMPKWQNEYGQGNGGVYAANSEASWGPKMQGQMLTDWTGKQSAFSPQPDNIKDFFRNALSINNSIGISSGSEKIQSYISYTNNSVQGLVRTNQLNRHTMNLRLSTQVSKRLNVEGKFTYMSQDLDNKTLTGESLGTTVYTLFQVPRNIRTDNMQNFESFDANGKRVQNYWRPGSAVLNNPYWNMNRRLLGEKRNRVTAFGLAKYEITDWLNAQLRISIDRYTDRLDQSEYAGSYIYRSAGSENTGMYGLGSNYVNERNIDFLLSGSQKLSEAFKINYNAGGQILRRDGEYNYNVTGPLIYPELFIPSNTLTLNNTYSASKRELQGLYATAAATFRNYLTLDVTARNDWSSTLPAANRSYFYPSIGLSAVVSEMTKLPSWISFAKVRASYAQVGNDASPYLTNQTYVIAQGGLNGWLYPNPTKVLPDIKPELTKSYELGLDWRFLKDRIGVDLTLYHTNTINQLLSLAVPAPSGFASKYVNVGNIQNEGIEIILSATPVQSRNFTWSSTLNAAANRNKVLELTPDLNRVVISDYRYAQIVVDKGSRIGDLYTQSWATDSATGKLLVDNNGLPVITKGNTKNVGNYNPDWTLGFSNTLRYSKLSLSFLISGRIGGIIESAGDALRTFAGDAQSTLPYREGGWVLPALVQSTGLPNTTAINAEQFWVKMGGKAPVGEPYIFDATNFRLREIDLGYNFHLSSKIKSARLAFVARNLFFLYRGSSTFDIPGLGKRKMDFDPDATANSGNGQGIEVNLLPTPRSYGVNLTLGF
jgi:TonB-linked SusC/RagA family outer membrane protein